LGWRFEGLPLWGLGVVRRLELRRWNSEGLRRENDEKGNACPESGKRSRHAGGIGTAPSMTDSVGKIEKWGFY